MSDDSAAELRIRLEGSWETLERFIQLTEELGRALARARWRDQVSVQRVEEVLRAFTDYDNALPRIAAYVRQHERSGGPVTALRLRSKKARDALLYGIRARLFARKRSFSTSLGALGEALRCQVPASPEPWELKPGELLLVDGRGRGDVLGWFARTLGWSWYLLTTRRLVFRSPAGDGELDLRSVSFDLKVEGGAVVLFTALGPIRLECQSEARRVATLLALRRWILGDAQLSAADTEGRATIDLRIVAPALSPRPGLAVLSARWGAFVPLAGGRERLRELTGVSDLDVLTAVEHLALLPGHVFEPVVRSMAERGGAVVEPEAGDLRTVGNACVITSVEGTIEVERFQFDARMASRWERQVFAAWVEAGAARPANASAAG